MGEPVSIATGSRGSKTQKLPRFGHFGIPCLQLFRGKEALQARAQFGFVRYDCFDDVLPGNVRMGLLVLFSTTLIPVSYISCIFARSCDGDKFVVLSRNIDAVSGCQSDKTGM